MIEIMTIFVFKHVTNLKELAYAKPQLKNGTTISLRRLARSFIGAVVTQMTIIFLLNKSAKKLAAEKVVFS